MRPALSDGTVREDLLDEVLTGYLKAVEAGQAPDREVWLARYPDLAADLRAFFHDQDQLERLAGPLRPAGRAARVLIGVDFLETLCPTGLAPLTGIETRAFGDYELLEVIAAGGMGVVYKARHRKLQHLVALKVLLAGRFARPSDLQRFRNEAETIAALDHPNIVPVYEVGEQDGQLYLSLRLLEGGTLGDRLARYRGDPRAAAALVMTVARAVHHAHQRGVLHRDLKPSNILLDADGQPHVADFGLARRLEDDSGLTQTGAILGTPSYMAPEQTVAGRRALTTAADVYGLGGILYALLTGCPPFQGADVFETMAQVRERTPESARSRNPLVSRDLAAICLKCLEKEPARRYASAQEFADDLGRYLRHEPTRARLAGPARRLLQWVRRQPALAALFAVTGLFFVVFVTSMFVHNWQLKAAAKRASDNEEKALRQQRLAAENYRQARDTINRMLARLEGRGLAEIPRLKELSQDQLEDALTFYQRTLDALDDPDPEVRRDTAVAYSRAAYIQHTLKRHEAAVENYRRAIGLLEGLPAATRDTSETRHVLIGCYIGLGDVAQNERRWDEAVRYYQEGLQSSERAVAELPGDPNARSRLAECEHNLGTVYQATRKLGEAETHYARAVTLRQRLIDDSPEDARFQAALAQSYVNLASIYQQTKRTTEAGDAYAKVELLLPPLIHAYPDNPDYSLTLVAAYTNWSSLLTADGRLEDALQILDRAVACAEAVLVREPNYQVARSQAYSAHGTRALIHEKLGSFADAVKDWDRVVDLDNNPDAWIRRGLRATALVKAGSPARAMAEVAALEGTPTLPADGLYYMATVCARAAEAASADTRLPGGERADAAERYASRGVGLLRKLKEQSYFKDQVHALRLLFDPNLNPLRGRDDFKQLLAPVGGTKPE